MSEPSKCQNERRLVQNMIIF